MFNLVPATLEIALFIGILFFSYQIGFTWITFVAVISYTDVRAIE